MSAINCGAFNARMDTFQEANRHILLYSCLKRQAPCTATQSEHFFYTFGCFTFLGSLVRTSRGGQLTWRLINSAHTHPRLRSGSRVSNPQAPTRAKHQTRRQINANKATRRGSKSRTTRRKSENRKCAPPPNAILARLGVLL